MLFGDLACLQNVLLLSTNNQIRYNNEMQKWENRKIHFESIPLHEHIYVRYLLCNAIVGKMVIFRGEGPLELLNVKINDIP